MICGINYVKISMLSLISLPKVKLDIVTTRFYKKMKKFNFVGYSVLSNDGRAVNDPVEIIIRNTCNVCERQYEGSTVCS